MNAKKILDQLMKQAAGNPAQGGTRSSAAPGSGMDVNKIVGGLASQLGGGRSSSGFDMKKLLGTGALGMLLGSRRGRRGSGGMLKYAAVAGIGALAWKAYQNHQASSGQGGQMAAPAQQGVPLERLDGPAQEQRGLEILQAMIMAARADGHIDADERARLTQEIEGLGADAELHAWVQAQFDAPLDAELLASKADSPQAAREIYLVSVAMIDEQNAMERAWLQQLAKALGLDAAMTKELERQVHAET